MGNLIPIICNNVSIARQRWTMRKWLRPCEGRNWCFRETIWHLLLDSDRESKKSFITFLSDCSLNLATQVHFKGLRFILPDIGWLFGITICLQGWLGVPSLPVRGTTICKLQQDCNDGVAETDETFRTCLRNCIRVPLLARGPGVAEHCCNQID